MSKIGYRLGFVLVVAAAGAAAPASAQTYAANCATAGCHQGQAANDPTFGRVNAAGSPGIIERARIINSMGTAGVFTLAFRTTIANEISALVTQTQSDNINYGATKNFDVNNLLFGGVIDTLQQVSGPTVTPSVVGSVGRFSYTHSGGAGGNCNTQAVVVIGRGTIDFGGGEPQANTSNRTVNITVNPPAAPTTANGSTTIAYSTSATAINVTSLGLVTGTPAGSSTTISLGTPSPNVGTVAATGPSSLNYTASSTVYAASVALNYTVTGPCSTTATTRTLTINVGLPPAPVVTNFAGGATQAVPATSNSTFDISSNITGIVQSNPAATYNLNVVSVTPGTAGTTSVAGNVITFIPSGTYTGPATITYNKAGPGGTSNNGTVSLEVTSSPVVAATSATTAHNTAIPINLAAFITGTVTSVTPSSPVNGTALATGPTTITFTPTTGFFGTATFNYTATGPGGTSPVAATVTVTVNPPIPTAGAGTATVPYQTATAINLSSFISPTGVPATVTSVTPSGATNGTATATGPTTVTFTPNAGYVGAASFNYTATNVAGTSAAGTVSVTVSPPGAPVASAASATAGVNSPVSINLSGSVSGVFSSIAIASLPANGLATVNGFVVTYTPSAGFQGNDSFTYTATGIGGTSAAATVFITVLPAPSIATLNITTPFNTAAQVNIGAAIAGAVTSFAIASPPSHGTLSGGASGVVTYTPTVGYFGPDAFVVIAVGPGGASSPVTVMINVTPPPPSPLPNALSVPVGFGATVTINLANAVSSVATSFTLVTPPANGTLMISGTTATYTPRAGFSGPDSFSVIPTGPGGAGSETFINLVVASQIPVARAAAMTINLNQSFTLDVAALLTGSGITGVNVVTQPAHGTADVAGTKLTYTPKTDFFGPDSFTYVAFGNAGTSAPATITVNVIGRPNLASDPTIMASATAQTQAAQRFARAQQFNFQRRLEALRSGLALEDPSLPPPEQTSLRPRTGTQTAVANIRNRATGVAAAQDPFAPLQSGNDAAGAAPGLGVKPVSADGPLPPSLVSTLVSLATGRSLDLALLNSGTAPSAKDSGVSVWVAGNVNFGRRDATADASGLKFTTDGLSIGVDRRFGAKWIAGLGLGYGRDDTDIGTDGSRLKARGSSAAVYGSYQLRAGTYLDGLLGVGKLDLDTRRFVTSQDAFATSKRKGDQLFGSIGASYDWRRDALLISPYGRIDFTRDKLKAATESGAGLASLTYLDQTQRSTQLALGVRLEIQHPTDFGWIKPRARIEYRHEFESDRDVTVAYADQFPSGQRYSLSAAGRTKDALAVGFGADFHYRGGLKLGIDYQAVRVKGPDSSQSVRLVLVKDLDAKPIPDNAVAWKTGKDAIRVETGYSWDDNVTRARDAASKLSDGFVNLGLSYGRFFPLGNNSRFAASAFFSGDKFRDYPGLGSASLGAQGEYQYRTSAAFDAVTFGIFARLNFDEFESSLRDGHRYAFGVNARRALTDRIDVFGELAGTVRAAKSAVFDRRDFSIRGNVDYALTKKGTLYLTAEYRRGDTVSTGFPSLENLDIAEVLVQDDAFDGRYFSYRTDAKTVIGTLGYNLSLGPRDSIDFSWRRAEARPLQSPGFQVSGPFRYVANQYAIIYLTRF
ncbi:MAG: autotransporter domain-containing protein [Burkholderiales bacterium]|nr:autotransporter domain-containing protein [Burkholderiales bacterium]